MSPFADSAGSSDGINFSDRLAGMKCPSCASVQPQVELSKTLTYPNDKPTSTVICRVCGSELYLSSGNVLATFLAVVAVFWGVSYFGRFFASFFPIFMWENPDTGSLETILWIDLAVFVIAVLAVFSLSRFSDIEIVDDAEKQV